MGLLTTTSIYDGANMSPAAFSGVAAMADKRYSPGRT